MSELDQCNNSTSLTKSPSLVSPPRKRPRLQNNSESSNSFASAFSPSQTHIVRVLRNDTRNKVICLHAKFSGSLDKDGIVILQKSPFPSELSDLSKAHLGVVYSGDTKETEGNEEGFPKWEATEVVNNDIYHQFTVLSGLEDANGVSMTVIHPAEAQHFSKYTASKRQIVAETPEIYRDIITPFLASHPKDLAWVDNILNGTAEVERVLLKDEDVTCGFTLVLDYRWDGKQLHELHALALAKDPELKCLRELRSRHVPMLKKMMAEGRQQLVAKYKNNEEGSDKQSLRGDQVICYFHYPPTFYRLHMHFIHVDASPDGGTQVGKAILAEDVIANIEMKEDYYAERTMPIYLHDSHPFLSAIREFKRH